jgi:hypothetical protein
MTHPTDPTRTPPDLSTVPGGDKTHPPHIPRSHDEQHSGGGWRPIESAPKDGTEFIVYRDDAGVFPAVWLHPPHEDGGRDDSQEPTLFCLRGSDLTREPPTHWMPLPAPPTEQTRTPLAESESSREAYKNPDKERVRVLEEALEEAERFMAYFADETRLFVGPGTPKTCLATIRQALASSRAQPFEDGSARSQTCSASNGRSDAEPSGAGD